MIDTLSSSVQGVLLLFLATILFIFMVTNLTGILIQYYFLKHEIEEIDNDDLQVDLLQALNSKRVVFFKRLLYHHERDFFDERKTYSKLIRYRLGLSNQLTYKPKIIDREEVGYARETIVN